MYTYDTIMCICQSSYGVLLTRGFGTRGSGSDEDVVFDKFPKEKLHGKRAKVFVEKKIAYDCKILKVTGHVTWRRKKSYVKDAKLILVLRNDVEGDSSPKLELAKYAHKPDEEGFTKTTFKFVPDDAEATNSYRFWNPGKEGVFGANE